MSDQSGDDGADAAENVVIIDANNGTDVGVVKSEGSVDGSSNANRGNANTSDVEEGGTIGTAGASVDTESKDVDSDTVGRESGHWSENEAQLESEEAQLETTADPHEKESAGDDESIRGGDTGIQRKRKAPERMLRVLPKQRRAGMLRACLMCSIVLSKKHFERRGCPNCDSILKTTAVDNMADECTSPHFEGYIALCRPQLSWVAKWQRTTEGVAGIYAVSIQGQLPDDVVRDLRRRNYVYRPRDGSVY